MPTSVRVLVPITITTSGFTPVVSFFSIHPSDRNCARTSAAIALSCAWLSVPPFRATIVSGTANVRASWSAGAALSTSVVTHPMLSGLTGAESHAPASPETTSRAVATTCARRGTNDIGRASLFRCLERKARIVRSTQENSRRHGPEPLTYRPCHHNDNGAAADRKCIRYDAIG